MENRYNVTIEDGLRLDAIVKNLNVGKEWSNCVEQDKEIIDACVKMVRPFAIGIKPKGEIFANEIAESFQVKVEELRNDQDLETFESRYLKQKKEIGFTQVRKEIHKPNIDAWLFQRMHAASDDNDRWVAVLNLTHTEYRAYWNRFHEFAHRIAEPPQLVLPYRRDEIIRTNPIERLMDKIAGNLAFYPDLLRHHLRGSIKNNLTFDIVNSIRENFAPTASLLSTANGIVKFCTHPTLIFIAEMRMKMDNRPETLALRVIPQARNQAASESNLCLFKNMRVPLESCVYNTFQTGNTCFDIENAKIWRTSDGKSLPDYNVFISAIRLDNRIYGIISK